MKKSALQAFALVFLSITLALCVVGLLELQTVYASPYMDIDVAMAYNMITGGHYPDLVVLDVRTQSEYDGGYIYGATLISHTELEARIHELTGHENREIIVYCRTGRRSVIASEILDSHNFSKVYNMLGGIQAWQSAGYPITNPMGNKATFWTALIPEFELGLWNAWIFFLLHQGLTSVLLILLFRDVWKDVWDVWKKDKTSNKKKSRRLEYSGYFVFFAVFGYSVFLPLQLNTVWFYVGLFIYLLGVIIDFMAGVSWATNSLDKPITTGIYSISRHPMDLGNFVAIVGTGIACASWVFLLLGIIMITLMNMSAVCEERFCLEKYGDAYREYMNRTPRWIGIPKSEKKD